MIEPVFDETGRLRRQKLDEILSAGSNGTDGALSTYGVFSVVRRRRNPKRLSDVSFDMLVLRFIVNR